RCLAGKPPDRMPVLRIGTGRDELRLGELVEILAQRNALRLLQPLERIEIDAVRIVERAGGMGTGDRPRAELVELLDRVDRHVAGARDQAGLALDGVAPSLEHVLREVDAAVAGRFAATVGAAPQQALAGQHAVVAPGQALVLAEQVADLARAHPDVARGHIDRRPDVAVQLGHERLAEAHDLLVGAALRIEVGAALGPTDRQAGERVLEDLLEAEELDDPGVDRSVETQAALVGSERGVGLHAVALVDPYLAPVVDPGDPEEDLPLRLDDALDDRGLPVALVRLEQRLERFEDFLDRLVEQRLCRARPGEIGNRPMDIRHGAVPRIASKRRNGEQVENSATAGPAAPVVLLGRPRPKQSNGPSGAPCVGLPAAASPPAAGSMPGRNGQKATILSC